MRIEDRCNSVRCPPLKSSANVAYLIVQKIFITGIKEKTHSNWKFLIVKNLQGILKSVCLGNFTFLPKQNFIASLKPFLVGNINV